ncbi:MAG: FG-GAP repeat protein [Steroidobacter sp.]
MRTTVCISAFPRLVLGCALAFFAMSSSAAPTVQLEKATLAPEDGAPEGGFGRAVAISGNVAVVSANLQSRIPGSGPEESGAVYVFERNSNGVWQQTAKLTSGSEGDLYGMDVAVDGNTIVVGAAFSRLTYVYEKQGVSWVAVAALGGTNGTGNGYSVAIDGNLIAISQDPPHGLALYRRGTTGWTQIASYQNGTGRTDQSGPEVDVSQNFAIHGSWGYDVEPETTGTAFIYNPGAGGNWAQPGVTSLTRPDGDNYPGGFASHVFISANTALIDSFLFARNSAGQWVNTARVPAAQVLDDDGVTLLGVPSQFRYIPLFRRDSSNNWPLQAQLITTTGNNTITMSSTDMGRALLASYPNAAYVYEAPSNLDGPALSQDDFQDGDANGWATTSGSLFAVASSGTFRFYRQSSVAGNSAALWQNSIGNTQAIQADITPRAFDGADRWFGLVTRYTDINNYYYVTARSGGGVQLKRMLAGTFTTLGSAAMPVAIGTTNRIRLEAVADHVRVLVDDRPVIQVRDSSLSGGRPGLMTYKARADFDNVVVNPNPAFVAFADDFERVNDYWDGPSWERVRGTAWNGSWIRRWGFANIPGRLRLWGAGQGDFGTPGDQIVQADLRPTFFGGNDRWVGLFARYHDEANYHYVTLRSSGTVDIRKLVNGNIQVLASAPYPIQVDTPYRVRLETIGTSVRVYLNGTLLAEATDPTLTPGISSVVIATYSAGVEVDNVWVTQP